jgi:putative DNA primase/helicase
VLSDCPIWSKDIQAQAKEADISWRTVRRAGDEMNIIKQKGAEGRWYWKLPRQSSANSSKLSNMSNLSSLDKLDNMPSEMASGTFERAQMGGTA